MNVYSANNSPIKLNLEIPKSPRTMIPKPILRRSVAFGYDWKENKAPDFVDPDMKFGLESISCELAGALYNNYRNKLIHIDKKQDLLKFIILNYKSIRPVHLCNCVRHASQILFALSNYYGVCHVEGNDIKWYLTMDIPLPPTDCLNQLKLIANVTIRKR